MRTLSPEQEQQLAAKSKEDQADIRRILALPEDRYRIVLAAIALASEADGGEPLTAEEREKALVLLLPELERLRALGRPQPELEMVARGRKIPAALAHKARPRAPRQAATQKERS